MQAIVFEEYGGPEVLQLRDIEQPEPGPGQIRASVRAAGVNPADVKIRKGWMQEVMPTEFPAVPGSEFSGVVHAVGDGVIGLSVGDEVLGWSVGGAYAQYTLADIVVPKPAGLSWDVAAALPVAGETARRVLDDLAVGAGDTLLVHGAAGSVGSMAVQLAVARGATVIGTASPANHDYVRLLGATPVAYGDGLVERVRAVTPKGVDAVFDTAGKGALPDSITLRGGTTDRVVTIADPTAAEHGVPFSGGGSTPEEKGSGLAEQARLATDGTLRVLVADTYPLAEAAHAQSASESGHTRGKLIIKP
ncbi:NADP-dependent oxidoreductase [Streptomyces sp. NBC_01498]|uniref:NADP-dependent oxidoreductase n=1 Tax=Streptomyces sp. NBC_01498 TaxID=2975870 RepID=UPI002E7BBDCE|nr:NADP-dependent oxidoreductase [Streptomyces sp. NBC_01498]WTL25438.1 NADP-dependent oxidoreductase [Streptomyces sp. NBC_01498]